MRASDAESRLVLPACVLSLALYACFSRLPRLWIKGLAYHRDLFLGIAPQIKTHLLNFYNSVLSPRAWNPGALVQMAAVIGLCILAAELTRKILGGHLTRFPAVPLFAFGYAVIPQSFLALVFWPDGRGQVTWINETAILAGAVVVQSILLAAGLRLKGHEVPKARSQSGLGIWGYVFVVPAALLLAVALIAGLQTVQGFDAISYHLPLSASLLSTGRTATGPDFQFLFPANPELAIRWFLTRGNDHFANLVSFLAVLFSVMTLYKIGRAIGQTRQSAAIAASCLMSIPLVPYQATSAYTDLCASMFTLMAVFYLCECWRAVWQDKARIVCCGLALGLGLGSKLSMIPGALVIFGCCMFYLINDGLVSKLPESESRKLMSSSSKHMIWLFCLSILPGCMYWFLRNWVLFGNPVYPVAVLGLPGYPMHSVAPKDIYLAGHPWGLLTYPWVEGDYSDLVDFYGHGVGAVFTAIVIPLALWWPIYMIRNRKLQTHRSARWFLYSLAVAFLLYFITQETTVTRFAILMILVIFFLIGEAWERLQSCAFKVAVALAFMLMFAGLTESLVGGIIYQFALGHREGIARYYAPPEIDRIPPSVILNAAGASHTYELMGSDYRHRVIVFMRDCTPNDAEKFNVQFVYLKAEDFPRYSATLNLKSIATSKTPYAENFVLCQVTGVKSPESQKP